MDGYHILPKSILFSLGLLTSQATVQALTKQQIETIVTQAAAKQGTISAQAPIIILINEQEKQSESWTPTLLKAGLVLGAFYAFDYYLFGGRVISHINKKTQAVLDKIAELRGYMKKRFDTVDTNMALLLVEIKKNNPGSTTQITQFQDETAKNESDTSNTITSNIVNTSWFGMLKFW